MGAAIKIMPARPDTDFDAVRQVYYQTWQAAYRNQMPDSYLAQVTPQLWQPEKRWAQTLLAVDAQDQIVGVCSFGPARLLAYTGWGEVYSIYILPAVQHHGLGQRLMQRALARLRPDFDQIYLRVLKHNEPAIHFYRQLGFQDTGVVLRDQAPFGVLQERVLQLKNV